MCSRSPPFSAFPTVNEPHTSTVSQVWENTNNQTEVKKEDVLTCSCSEEGPPCEPVVEAHYREGAETAKYARWLHDVIGKRMISPFKLGDRGHKHESEQEPRKCPPMPAGLVGTATKFRRHYVVASASTIGSRLPGIERIRTTALSPMRFRVHQGCREGTRVVDEPRPPDKSALSDDRLEGHRD